MNEAELLRLAQQVSEDTDVDWDGIEDDRVVHNLRLLQRIGRAHDSDDDEADPGRWGHLELVRKLGGGTFGDIWEAYDPTLHCTVALKLMRDGRFIAEARHLARIRHPNVAVVHGAAAHDGKAGLWMELVDGDTLGDLLKSHGAFGAHEAALIGVSVCRALSAMHADGLLHRDVKAQNVMREHGGRILLMDFGGALDFGALRSTDEISPTGTPIYMAPELFAGEAPSVASDIYSVGVLLFHLVTRAFPVEAEDLAALARRHESCAARLLRDVRSDLPESFQRVVERATDRDPAGRFESAGEMERALANLVGRTAPAPVSHRPVRPARGRRTTIVALLTAVVVIVVAVALTRPWAPAASSPVVDATFLRVRTGEARSPLASGDPLRLGDGLQLDFESAVPVHLYVLNEDDSGHAFALFPIEASALRNPLAPGRVHTLPGRQAWEVSSTGGRERLLVVATTKRLADFELEMARLPQPTGIAAPIPDAAGKVLTRGLGRLMSLPEDASNNLWQLAETLEERGVPGSDVWIRTFTFENPTP